MQRRRALQQQQPRRPPQPAPGAHPAPRARSPVPWRAPGTGSRPGGAPSGRRAALTASRSAPRGRSRASGHPRSSAGVQGSLWRAAGGPHEAQRLPTRQPRGLARVPLKRAYDVFGAGNHPSRARLAPRARPRWLAKPLTGGPRAPAPRERLAAAAEDPVGLYQAIVTRSHAEGASRGAGCRAARGCRPQGCRCPL